MTIIGKTKVKEALKEHPELKEVLINLSPKFKKLDNPFVFKVISQWATFNDIAKVGNLSICEILHTVNKAIGNEEEVYKSFPECIKEEAEKFSEKKPEWLKDIKQFLLFDAREMDGFFLPELIKKLKELKPGEALNVINDFDPVPLKRMLEEENYEFYAEKTDIDEYLVTIKYKEPEPLTNENWKEHLDQFEELNVIGMKVDPFETIIKKAQTIPEGKGFTLVQMFEPTPLINMLNQMGFEHFTQQESMFRFKIHFFKTIKKKEKSVSVTSKIPVVIQSATPITYPIIMRMLQSEKLMDKIEIKELKVWEETEKHMAWVVNKKADITFSAVAAAAKLYLTNVDIKMVSINIWDNFHLLTRGYDAKTFADLKGHKIHVPLFREAPPKIMMNFLMKQNGYNPDDFEFVFGNPFGRPEQIKDDFINGKADTVLLREPEASYAVFALKDDVHESISFAELWKTSQKTDIDLPNAGLLFAGEFLRKYPEIAELFVQELKNATDWVNTHKKEAAMQAYDIMRHTPEEVEFFLSRAHFQHTPTKDVLDAILNYLQVLEEKEKFSPENLRGLFV